MASKKPDTLKGNAWWALAYALTSLRNYPVRNMGIALILSIGVALPTTVFVWSTTGTDIAVETFFDREPIQMTMVPRTDESAVSSDLAAAASFVKKSPFIEEVHTVPTTVGILVGDFHPSWGFYNLYGLNYLNGIKDGRVLLVTNDFISNISYWLNFQGNTSLSAGEILVSSDFVDRTFEVYGFTIEVGSIIDLDMLKRADDISGTPEDFSSHPLRNMTVTGIYSTTSKSGLMLQAFPSISRKNWDPFGYTDTVLGIRDSIMILQDEVSEDDLETVHNSGFFDPPSFIQPSKENLMKSGAANIAINLVNLRTQMNERYPLVYIDGLIELWQLNSFINTYLNSQVLTVIALPILVMSLMLTVFTSETSVARRKSEISALRAKGASFNQVFTTFMWESIFLSIAGLLVGIILAVFMAPLIASSTGLFTFDLTIYMQFLGKTQFTILTIVIAIAISMYLPAAYLVHVARRIDVTEIGQPMTEEPETSAEDVSVWRFAAGLGVSLAILIGAPLLVDPTSTTALIEILIASLMLFAAAYLGSRFMQILTARMSGGTTFLMGEKSLYLSKSLRRRRRQFIPLLVILTLTLTTTMMMVIQSSSFEATMDHEIEYALGADMRVECDSRLLRFNSTLLSYPGVQNVTPVVQTNAQIGTNRLFLTGVDAERYLEIGAFTSESFLTGSPSNVLSDLAATENGIIISEYHSVLWNKTVGDEIRVRFNGRAIDFLVVATMLSAPGLGMASLTYLSDPTIATIFNFQLVGEGFLIANVDFLANQGSSRADLFLVKTLPYANLTDSIRSINNLNEIRVLIPESFNAEARSYTLGLFLSGFQGLTMIGFVMCTFMGLASLALFLGSAVLERKSEYALFRAMGGSKKQVISMVFGEFAGSVVTAIAISAILGVLFGYSMSIMSFGISPFSPALAEVLAYPLMALLAILALESVVMLASCYFPAKRASDVDPASALRNL